MSKVMNSYNFNVVESEDKTNSLTLLMGVDEDGGYGVEYSDEDSVLASWYFGDNSIESYILAEKLLAYIAEIQEKLIVSQNIHLNFSKLPVKEGYLPGALISAGFSIEDETPTQTEKKDVEFIIYLLERYYGKPAITEHEVEETRKNFNWPKETGLWSHLIQKSA